VTGRKLQTAKLFLVASNPFGQGFDGGAQMANLRDQARHGSRVVTMAPVLLDHHPPSRIPVKRGADSGGGGDRRDGHGFMLL
jgi:hypothetical protein